MKLKGVSLYCFGFFVQVKRGVNITKSQNLKWNDFCSRMTMDFKFSPTQLISCKMGVDATETVQGMTFGKPGARQNTNFSFSQFIVFSSFHGPTWIFTVERSWHNSTTISLQIWTVPVNQGLFMCIVWKV